MGRKLSPAQNELYQRTDEVLHYIWDPIGISDSPYARDEYWSYLAHVFRMLIEDASAGEIAETLVHVESGAIGLSPDHRKARHVAEVLIEYKAKIYSENP